MNSTTGLVKSVFLAMLAVSSVALSGCGVVTVATAAVGLGVSAGSLAVDATTGVVKGVAGVSSAVGSTIVN